MNTYIYGNGTCMVTDTYGGLVVSLVLCNRVTMDLIMWPYYTPSVETPLKQGNRLIDANMFIILSIPHGYGKN